MEVRIIVSIGVAKLVEDATRVIIQRQILLSDNPHQYLTSSINIALMRKNKIKRNKGKAMSSRKILNSFVKNNFIWK